MNRIHIYTSALALFAVHAAFAGSEKIRLPSGAKLTVIVERPKVAAGKASRLCILVPPGPGTKQMAEAAKSSLGKEFVKRGWVVAIPVSPDGKAFFGKNSKLVIELLKLLQKRAYVTSDKALIAGISNGGIAALEIGSQAPQSFCGIVAVPGVLSGHVQLKKLRNMPIYLRLGAKDELQWGRVYKAVVAHLQKAGAKLDTKLLPNAGHSFRVNWKELDAWLKGLAPAEEQQPKARGRTSAGARNRGSQASSP